MYAGRAGSGFDDQQLGDVRKELEGMTAEDAAMPAPARPARRTGGGGEEGYQGEDADRGRLRHDDRRFRVHDVGGAEAGGRGAVHRVDQRGSAAASGVPAVPGRQEAGGLCAEEARKARRPGMAQRARTVRRAGRAAEGGEEVKREVPFSNLKKIYWPKDKYTKGDLIDYYRLVAPALLPYLRDRPLVLTRYPDGIEGKSFFQKDAPDFVPGMGADGAAVERGPAPRDRLHRVRRRGVAAVRREPGVDSAAHVGKPGGGAGEARLVHPRPGPEGGAVHRRGEGGARDPRAVRARSTCRTTSRPRGRAGCT